MYQKFSVQLEKLIHRVKIFIDHKELSMRQFDLSIHASDGYTQRTLKNSGSVGSDIIEKILHTYPEINPYWLLTGEQKMFRNNSNSANENTLIEAESEYGSDNFEKLLLSYFDRPSIKNKIEMLVNNRIKELNYEGEK